MLNDCCTSYTEKVYHTLLRMFKALLPPPDSSLRHGQSWISDAYWRWILIKFREQCIADICTSELSARGRGREIDLIYDESLLHHHHHPSRSQRKAILCAFMENFQFPIFHYPFPVSLPSPRHRRSLSGQTFFPQSRLIMIYENSMLCEPREKSNHRRGFKTWAGKINFNPQRAKSERDWGLKEMKIRAICRKLKINSLNPAEH